MTERAFQYWVLKSKEMSGPVMVLFSPRTVIHLHSFRMRPNLLLWSFFTAWSSKDCQLITHCFHVFNSWKRLFPPECRVKNLSFKDIGNRNLSQVVSVLTVLTGLVQRFWVGVGASRSGRRVTIDASLGLETQGFGEWTKETALKETRNQGQSSEFHLQYKSSVTIWRKDS